MIALVALGVATGAGCSIRHEVVKDYPQYLINAQGESHLPRTAVASKYALEAKTAAHRYEFRSGFAGRANVWVVEFGKMLDATLQSSDVQAAFGHLGRSGADDPREGVLIFDLQRYEFSDMSAHVALQVTHRRGGVAVFTRIYASDGDPQGGKMVWGGSLAMKNAIQASSKHAIDDILRQLIADLNKAQAGKG